MILTLIITFSALFVATHIGLSHGTIREGLVAKLGRLPFMGLYSVISFLTLGPAAVLWWQNRHLGPVLWEVPFWLERALAVVLMLLAFQLLMMMLATPSPASFMPTKIEARGVLRITRHPMNIAFASFGLAHMLANGALGDVAFFGSFLALGILGPLHQDLRMKREKGEPYREFCRQTSVLPFVAILTRRNRPAADELPFPLGLLGIVIFVVIFVFHGRFFGAGLF